MTHLVLQPNMYTLYTCLMYRIVTIYTMFLVHNLNLLRSSDRIQFNGNVNVLRIQEIDFQIL